MKSKRVAGDGSKTLNKLVQNVKESDWNEAGDVEVDARTVLTAYIWFQAVMHKSKLCYKRRHQNAIYTVSQKNCTQFHLSIWA